MCDFLRGGGDGKKDVKLEYGKAFGWSCGSHARVMLWWNFVLLKDYEVEKCQNPNHLEHLSKPSIW